SSRACKMLSELSNCAQRNAATKSPGRNDEPTSWQEVGSSFLPGDLVAAFLWAQFESSDSILHARLDAWALYHALLAPLEAKGVLRRPHIPEHCGHNAHMYYIVLSPEIERQSVLGALKAS